VNLYPGKLLKQADNKFITGTIPEPTAILTERKRAIRMPPPRSKSPMKTYLQSPARRHPSFAPGSSPLRGPIITPSRVREPHSVKRILDFSVDDFGSQSAKATERGSPQKRPMVQKPAMKSVSQSITGGKLVPSNLKPAFNSGNGSDYEQNEPQRVEERGDEEDSYQVMNCEDENGLESGNNWDTGNRDEQAVNGTLEAESDSILKPAKKRGRPPMAKATAIKQGKGRPPRKSTEKLPYVESDAKEAQEAEDDMDDRPVKKPRNETKSATTKGVSQKSQKPAIQTSRSTLVKPNSSPINISSPAVIQRGPPRPKNSRGLYILRRETPDDSSHTRSGRHVIKPVAYWKNETVVYGEDEEADGETSFLLPTIKGVIRAEEIEEENPRRGTKKGTNKSKKRRQVLEEDEEEDEDLAEPWESEPGRKYGEVRVWDPEDPSGEMSEEAEDEIALSSAAIITRDIPGASFRFAKTLTLPFFGSGMVDLPPGAVKKTKNSRRMQMVFFVFYGRVSVTVNGTAFRIGKGGMWQVPRGKEPLIHGELYFLTIV
jgi:centromere protein C